MTTQCDDYDNDGDDMVATNFYLVQLVYKPLSWLVLFLRFAVTLDIVFTRTRPKALKNTS